MGIYDRDYFRQGRSGFSLGLPRTAVVGIILVNVAVYGLELLDSSQFGGRHSAIADRLAVHVAVGEFRSEDTLTHPWMWWQLLTCGFVHDPRSLQHIIFNMLTLYFLGRDVEEWFGTREFIRLYLVMLVFSSLVWAIATRLTSGYAQSFGASGAISGVVVLYALLFPRRTLLMFMVLPVPAWLVGVLAVGYDMMGATGRAGEGNVAYSAHLGGAAFATMYFYMHWNFGRAFQAVRGRFQGLSRPSLKVFEPDAGTDPVVADDEVDRILEKIHREGEGSLTRKERRILESASREYQQRRRSE